MKTDKTVKLLMAGFLGVLILLGGMYLIFRSGRPEYDYNAVLEDGENGCLFKDNENLKSSNLNEDAHNITRVEFLKYVDDFIYSLTNSDVTNICFRPADGETKYTNDAHRKRTEALTMKILKQVPGVLFGEHEHLNAILGTSAAELLSKVHQVDEEDEEEVVAKIADLFIYHLIKPSYDPSNTSCKEALRLLRGDYSAEEAGAPPRENDVVDDHRQTVQGVPKFLAEHARRIGCPNQKNMQIIVVDTEIGFRTTTILNHLYMVLRIAADQAFMVG